MPLLLLLQPNREDDIIQSLLAEYRERNDHAMPVWTLWGSETWCMIGFRSAPPVVDAYLKGFKGFDAHTCWLPWKIPPIIRAFLTELTKSTIRHSDERNPESERVD